MGAVRTGKSSSNDMAAMLGDTEGKTLSRQAFRDRMDPDSVRFMMRCIAKFASLKTVRAHPAARAFWLSRLPVGTTACDTEGRSIESILKTTGAKRFRIKVRIGADGREAWWLVAVRATREEVSKRRRKRKSNARKNGVTPLKNTLLRDDWHLVVTNIEPDMMSARDIAEL